MKPWRAYNNEGRLILPDPTHILGNRGLCNAPLTHDGEVVGVCQIVVKRGRPHRGKHRLEWGDQ